VLVVYVYMVSIKCDAKRYVSNEHYISSSL